MRIRCQETVAPGNHTIQDWKNQFFEQNFDGEYQLDIIRCIDANIDYFVNCVGLQSC